VRSLLPIVAVSILACASAHAARPDAPADFVVTGYRWGKVTSKTIITSRGTFTVDPDFRLPPRPPGMAPPKILLRREAYLQVHNTGTRTVKAVKWTYVFYRDAARTQEVARFDFRSKATVKPGEMKCISENVEEEAPTAFERVVVQDVEYDGDAKR
jgi:hypothetical protein